MSKMEPTLQEEKVFLLEKLVKGYPKWPLSNLTKVPSLTNHFGPGHFDYDFLVGFFIVFFY
jgi:hypothetical protein